MIWARLRSLFPGGAAASSGVLGSSGRGFPAESALSAGSSSSPAAPLLNLPRVSLLWTSGGLAMLSLTPAMNGWLALMELLVFLAILWASIRQTSIPPELWRPRTFRPWTRLLVFLGMLFGIVLVSRFAVSTEAGTALLGSTLVIKFMEIRSDRDARILVVLNTMAPFIAFLQLQSPFLLGLGVLALIVNHAAATALTEHTSTAHAPLPYLVGRVVRVLVTAVAALPLVLAFYMIIPRLDNPLWSGLMHQRSQTGVGPSMNIAQWTSIMNDMSTAFRVSFPGKTPPPSSLYFRVRTLWTFDGQVWSAVPERGAPQIIGPSTLPGPNGWGDIRPGSDPVIAYTVSYETPRTLSAPVLDRPVAAPPGWAVNSDGEARRTDGKMSQGQMVTWRSAPPAAGVLSESDRVSALQVPAGLNPRAAAWARAQHARTPDAANYVQAVLTHFRTQYTYSLSPPPLPDSVNAVDSFLFETKTGFCAHYASAFVTLMRDAGIPARVVVGYVQGEASPLGNYMRFRQADAHAWAEVWLNNRWQRFDPTAQVTNTTVRSDLSWSIWDKATGVTDMVGVWWSTWVTYYDQAAREKIIHDLRTQAEMTLDKVRPLPPWALLLAIPALALMGWGMFLRRRRPMRTMSDGAAHIQDRLLELAHAAVPSASLSRAQSWSSLERLIAAHLSSDDRTALTEALLCARAVIYRAPRSREIALSPGRLGLPSTQAHRRLESSPSRLWPSQRLALRRVFRELRRLKIVDCSHE